VWGETSLWGRGGGERERVLDVLCAMQICYSVLEEGWEEAAWRE
jgi:hypothetical protein